MLQVVPFTFLCKQIHQQSAKVALIPSAERFNHHIVQHNSNKCNDYNDPKKGKNPKGKKGQKDSQCSLFCLRPTSTSSSPVADLDCCSSRS